MMFSLCMMSEALMNTLLGVLLGKSIVVVVTRVVNVVSVALADAAGKGVLFSGLMNVLPEGTASVVASEMSLVGGFRWLADGMVLEGAPCAV